MDQYQQANLELWNDWATRHAAMRSEEFGYNLEAFRAGRCTLYQQDLDDVGPVEGKRLLHLQCHIGVDTLSWARRGARVTGADFSDRAIAVAQGLSDELGLGGRFVCTDLYRLPEVLHERFEVVYTSYGVLSWLRDVPRWGQIVAHFLEPGGIFYLAEIHPMAMVFDERQATSLTELRPTYSYFPQDQPTVWPVEGSYAEPRDPAQQAGRSAPVEPRLSYEWTYTLGGVVTALIEAGLTIEFVHEYPECCYPHFPWMQRDERGWWRQPDGRDLLPMTLTVRAHR